MALVVSALILRVAGVLTLLIRGGEGGDERDPTVAAVCRVAALARAGDSAHARRVLVSDAHGPRHTVAQEAADESAPEGVTATNADALVAATVAAAETAGRSAEGCT